MLLLLLLLLVMFLMLSMPHTSPSAGASVDAVASDAFASHGVAAFTAAFVGIGVAAAAVVSASCASCVFDFFLFFT